MSEEKKIKTVVVVADVEQNELTLPSLECVEEAREVADRLDGRVQALLCGHQVAPLAQRLAAHGADLITVVEHEALAQFSADGWLAALAPVLWRTDPTLLLAPDSAQIRAWLPRLSTRWRAPLVSRCIRVNIIADGYPEMIRATYGGARQERLVWPYATPVSGLLVAGVRGVGAPQPDRRAEITVLRPELDAAAFRDRTLRTLPADPRTVDLSEAERILAGGLGVGGPEGVAQLQRLAELLGAALGGTRVIADRGWLEHDRYIGVTGKLVSPKLYIGLGISGATQHSSGITGDGVLIAVNTDRTAPLLGRADLGVVGDLHQIVPILLRKLEQRASASTAATRASAAP